MLLDAAVVRAQQQAEEDVPSDERSAMPDAPADVYDSTCLLGATRYTSTGLSDIKKLSLKLISSSVLQKGLPVPAITVFNAVQEQGGWHVVRSC